MACNEWAERISAYIDDEVTAEERGAVEAHLAACPDCAKASKGLRRVSDIVRSLPPVAAPVGMVDSVRAAIAPPQQGRLLGFIGRNRAWASSAAAAVATMLIVYGFYSPTRNRYQETLPEAPPVFQPPLSKADAAEHGATFEKDKAIAAGEQPDEETFRRGAAAPDPSGDTRKKAPAPPQPEQSLAQKEAKDQDGSAGRMSNQGVAVADAVAPPDAGPGGPGPATAGPADAATAPGAPAAPAESPELAKEREARKPEGLAQDFLQDGQQVAMLCGDAEDAERKVTGLLRDLRVNYDVQENHTTHVVAQIPADRAEEVLLALEMLEPQRFGWRVPSGAGDEASQKDLEEEDLAGARASSEGGVAPGKGGVPEKGEENARVSRLRDRLAEDYLEKQVMKAKSLDDREEKRAQASSLTLVISLEPRPAADPATESGK